MNIPTKSTLLAALLAVAILAGPAGAQQKEEGVAVTVYNGGYAVVRELRNLQIDKDGVAKFTDVATGIDPTTVHFRSLTDAKAKLLEQNYQYDLVSANKLLQKYIDRPIDVVCKGKTYSGTLMSFDGVQLVLKEDSGGIVMVRRPDNVQDIRFKVLPEGLLTKPTLVWLVDTDKAGKQLCEVTYQTSGMQWHAEYVLVLNQDDTGGDLTGWVSVQNNSGKAFKDARMKFIAGDVRKIQDQPRRIAETAMRKGRREDAGMQEKAFFEYHMYTLGRPSTVANNEVKQLEMFDPARGLKVTKKYLFNPMNSNRWHYGSRYTNKSYGIESPKKVNVFVEFKNTKDNKLGIPMPAGKVRVYKQDPADEALEFIGEERIDHTPKDEPIELLIGNAFDIVGERKQVNFRVESGRHWMQEKIEIEIRNHKDEDVTVRVKEPMYRWTNWTITESNQQYEKLDARNVAWDVKVKANGKTKVTYTVEYTW